MAPMRMMNIPLFDDEVFVHDWGALSEGPFMQLLVVESF